MSAYIPSHVRRLAQWWRCAPRLRKLDALLAIASVVWAAISPTLWSVASAVLAAGLFAANPGELLRLWMLRRLGIARSGKPR